MNMLDLIYVCWFLGHLFRIWFLSNFVPGTAIFGPIRGWIFVQKYKFSKTNPLWHQILQLQKVVVRTHSFFEICDLLLFRESQLKVSKSRKQFMVSSIFSKKQRKITILSTFSTQNSEFCLSFGKIEETIIVWPLVG